MKNNNGNNSINPVNIAYLEAFQQARYPNINTDDKQRTSWNQYKCTLMQYLPTLAKDAAMTKREDIDAFLNGTKNVTNKKAHIKSFYIFLITTNHKNIQSKISRDLLVKLLEM